MDKARQLAAQEVALAHAQANILAELSAAMLSRNDLDSALRLASRGTRIDLALPADKTRASPAAAALAAAVSQANWLFAFGGQEDAARSAAFSPDGSRIVTASEDNTARIWDAASAKEIAVLRGHDGFVNSAAFSPNGSRIVTASNDNAARIWDAATATEIAVLRGHEGRVVSAAFSPDGSRIVTASEDKTARIWDAHLQMMGAKDLLAEACARLDGLTKLTRDEMRLAGYPDSVPEIDVCTSSE